MEYEIECPACGYVGTIFYDRGNATISVDIMTLTPVCAELATGNGLTTVPFCPNLDRAFQAAIRA